MDSALAPTAASDVEDTEAELPVDVDSIAIDATQPEVGDQVSLKVDAQVTRLVNGIAYCKPTMINDMPLIKPPLKPSPQVDEMTRLEQMSQSSAGGADTNEY